MKSRRTRSCEENSNDDQLLLKYYEVLDRLESITDQLRLEKVKVRALEDEIDEMQTEQEMERLEYTDTIKSQQEQIKALMKEARKSSKRVSFEK